MSEFSIYEKRNPSRMAQQGGFALGRITAIDPDMRLVEVKTFFASNPALKDHHLPNCQWLNGDAGTDGDESTSIPRINSFCLVFFVEGEALVWGFYSPPKSDQSPAGEILEKANSGDKILKTIGQNKVILRSGGEIEIQSTETCRTFMLPDGNTIDTLCRNYLLNCDGGNIEWGSDDGEALYFQEWRDTLARTQVIQEQRGFVDSTTLWTEQMGLGIPGGLPGDDIIPIWEKEVLRTGETTFKLHPPLIPLGFTFNVQATGEFSIEVGESQFSFSVSPAGAMDLSINDGLCDLSISATGALDISVGEGLGELTMSPTGEVKVTATTGITLDSTTDVTIKANTGITLQSLAPITIKALGGISLDGGTGAVGSLLLFPLALSQFTGLPIMAPSVTLKGSF